jgi:hypothetical protein
MDGIAHRNFFLSEQKIFNHSATAGNELAKYNLAEGFPQV